MSLDVLYANPQGAMKTVDWLDQYRDHVVTCLHHVGASQLAELLGLPHHVFYAWIKSRDVGPIVDARGRRRIPNLERASRPEGTSPPGGGPAPLATPVANMPDNMPTDPPAQLIKGTPWPDLDLALQQAYREIDARLSPEAIEELRCRLQGELAKAYDSRMVALAVVQGQSVGDFLRGGALPFMTVPLRVIGGGHAEKPDPNSGSELRLIIRGWDSWDYQLTASLPDGTYRFLVLAIPVGTPASAD